MFSQMKTKAYQTILECFKIIDKELHKRSQGDSHNLQYSLWLEKGYNNLGIDDLYTIKELDLSYSLIVELPSEFAYLTTLEHINLAGNYIEEVPRWVWQMSNLKELILGNLIAGGNPIKTLSADIRHLQKLEMLDIRNLHDLEALPNELLELKNLFYIQITQMSLYESDLVQKMQKMKRPCVMFDEPFLPLGEI